MTAGYLNNPRATKDAFAGGWFHTGDQGWLDETGYLTLTGRLKELINRGGEKISPLEIDAALLSHPKLAEAVAFGMPDEKYGEVVHAAVVLKDGNTTGVSEDELKNHCKSKLAPFKIPIKFHFLTKMPKTPTGKIQRRMVRAHVQEQGGSADRGNSTAAAKVQGSGARQGFDVVAECLSHLGVDHMLGIVGIPVTQLASSAQANGIRFVGFRNEQSAGYAASCMGFLTGKPAALLTVSGPGFVHGLVGLMNATENCWPLLMISGSVERSAVGKGGFQELDQCQAARSHAKAVFQIKKLSQVPAILSSAVHESLSGRPGGVYVDLPADVLFASAAEAFSIGNIKQISQDVFRATADESKVAKAASLLSKARKPLVIVGKGAAYSRSEREIRHFVQMTGIPVLPSPMGKGLLPDSHALCVGPARSKAMRESDVVLVLGTRLNWQWHFGEPPKWSSSAKFIIVDTLEPKKRSKHCVARSALNLDGDAKTVLSQLTRALYRRTYSSERIDKWVGALMREKETKQAALQKTMDEAESAPMGFHQIFGIISRALDDLRSDKIDPTIVNEGANTMDVGRQCLEINTPRTRLDAGTLGTMGVGLGSAIASALADPKRPVLAVLGDSAFGFSAMECEVIARYNLPVVLVVLNNGGVYGGDRRKEGLRERASAGLRQVGFDSDPPPTAFVPDAKYELVMKAFHGQGKAASLPDQLFGQLTEGLRGGGPVLINVVVDPQSGVESARMIGMNQNRSKL